MSKNPIRAIIAAALFAVVPVVHGQAPKLVGGVPYLPDEELLATRGLPWAYNIAASSTSVAIGTRAPTATEQAVVDRAGALLASTAARAIALLDGPTIVFAGYKDPATEASLFFSASISKTVTSLAVGQAICHGKLSLDDRAADRIPELAGKALGRATVRDLLRMASGAATPSNPGNASSGNIMTPEQARQWRSGQLDLVGVIAEDRVAAARRGVFSDYGPGEHFDYKNTDPLALGLMIAAATGVSYAEWVQKTVFEPAGIQGPGWISQNLRRQALADSGLRLRMEDWARLAWWVRRSSTPPDCFGGYLRDATSTQIANGSSRASRRTAPSFAGYGYLIWTENEVAPDTYWAVGAGGQRIGWNTRNDRMLIAFSNVENWMGELSALFRDWSAMR